MINPSNYCYGIEGNEKAHKIEIWSIFTTLSLIYHSFSNSFFYPINHASVHEYIAMAGSGLTVTESDTSNLCIRGLTF